MKKNIICPFFLIIFIMAFATSINAAPKMLDRSLSVEETNRQLSNPESQSIGGTTGIGGIGPNSGAGLGYENNNYGYDQNIGFDDNARFGEITGFNADMPIDANMVKQLEDINARNMQGNSFPLTSGLPPPNRGRNQQNFINVFCSSGYAPKINLTDTQQACMENQRKQACERFGRININIKRILSKAIDCESNTNGYIKSGCDGLDTSRLDLLKQYWQDEDIAYTILFLPDMVLNSPVNCSEAAKHGRIQ